jgi:pyruvate carboxylase
MTDSHDPGAAYSEVFEEGKDQGQTQTIHRIRANSTIMQLKKILGEYPNSLGAELRNLMS